MRVLRGVVYMTKSSGPRTEPWGTPQEDVYQEDRSVYIWHGSNEMTDLTWTSWEQSHGYQTRMRDGWSRCHDQQYRKQQRGRVIRGMILSVILLHWRGDRGYTKELFQWSDVCSKLTSENWVDCWKWGDPWDGIWRHVLLLWKLTTLVMRIPD